MTTLKELARRHTRSYHPQGWFNHARAYSNSPIEHERALVAWERVMLDPPDLSIKARVGNHGPPRARTLANMQAWNEDKPLREKMRQA